VIKYSNLRRLPSKKRALKEPDNQAGDELQVDTLANRNTAWPVMHESADKKWCYVVSQFNAAVVELNNIAYCEHKIMEGIP